MNAITLVYLACEIGFALAASHSRKSENDRHCNAARSWTRTTRTGPVWHLAMSFPFFRMQPLTARQLARRFSEKLRAGLWTIGPDNQISCPSFRFFPSTALDDE